MKLTMFPELSETDVLSKIKLGGVPDYLIRICQKDIIEQPSIEGQIVGKEAVKLISRQSRTEKRNEVRVISSGAACAECRVPTYPCELPAVSPALSLSAIYNDRRNYELTSDQRYTNNDDMHVAIAAKCDSASTFSNLQ
nr:uncharacterized protein LOC109159946 [Ipomoea trifida]